MVNMGRKLVFTFFEHSSLFGVILGLGTMEHFFVNYMNPLKDYLMIDFIGGPRPLQMRHIINLQKGSTLLVMTLGMIYCNNFSPTACVYTGLHGSYGLIWLMKDHIMPDPRWNVYITIPGTLMIAIGIFGYWVPGYLIIAYGVVASPIRIMLCILLHTIGVVLMMSADAQKYYTLRLQKGLVGDGWLAHSRNTNYLGEVMLYSAYPLLAQHWLPWAINCTIWLILLAPNMYTKDVSLRKKRGGEAYFRQSYIFLPHVGAWYRETIVKSCKPE